MTLRQIIAVIAVPVYMLCMGLHVAGAPDVDQLESVLVPASVDQTAELQQLCDRACQPGGSRTVDLGGRVWWIRDAIRLGPQHNRIEIENGELLSPPDLRPAPRYGLVELCRGITWRGVTYGDGPLSVTFERVTFAGLLSNLTDDTETNRERCKLQGYFCSGINAMNGSRVNGITCRNCNFRNLFAGVNAQSSLQVKVHYCEFDRIATICLASSVPPDNNIPMRHDLYMSTARDCGSLFDFSGPEATAGTLPPVQAMATVRRCTAINTTGRAKFHAAGWDGLIQRTSFGFTRTIPNRFAAISVPWARNVIVEDCPISGYFAGGIESSNDRWTFRPTITVRRGTIDGGQLAINSSAVTRLEDVTIRNCLLPWGGSTVPSSQAGTIIDSPASLDDTARRFAMGREIVRAWNGLHGSSNNPENWWYLVPTVRARVQEIETATAEAKRIDE